MYAINRQIPGRTCGSKTHWQAPLRCFSVLRSLMLMGVLMQVPAASAIDISDSPLELHVNAPAPVVMLVWDDSSSMDGEFMTLEPKGLFDDKKYLFPDEAWRPSPDHVDGRQRALCGNQLRMWRSQWSGYNRMYYDPRREYRPWPATARHPFGPADAQRPWSDPVHTDANAARLLLSSPFFNVAGAKQSISIPNAHYFILDDSNANGKADKAERIYLVAWQDADGDQVLDLGNTIADDHRRYYRFNDDGDGVVEDDELRPLLSEDDRNGLMKLLLEDRTGAERRRTDGEELQNFANWFTYHRRREFAAKAAAARLITGLDRAYIGIYALNRAPRIAAQPMLVTGGNASTTNPGHLSDSANPTAGTGEKVLDALYVAQSDGETPLRMALAQVGRYFDQASASTLVPAAFKPAEQGGGCQSAHAVVISDGFWNGEFSGIGNADGDQGEPYGDAWQGTLADVAMYYYNKDLAADLPDQVPPHSCDGAVHQHLRTNVLSFGVSGSIDLPGLEANGAAPDLCLAVSEMPPPAWPRPEAGQSAMIDDLLHAAVNGRGIVFPVGDPQVLIDVLKDRSGAKGAVSQAGPTVGGLELNDRSVIYQVRYRPGEWTGDVLAFACNPSSADMELEADGAIWHAAAYLAPSDAAWEARRIVTYGGRWREPQGVPFRYSELSDGQRLSLGSDLNPGSASDRRAAELLEYIRGREFRHLRKRSSLLGDIVHSAPVLVGDTLLAGANDGMLHAFDVQTGRERFAYVPNLVYGQLPMLSRSDYATHHRFYVDAPPYAGEVLEDRYRRKTYLLGGLGKGGKGYYCLCLQDRRRTRTDVGWSAYETLFSVDDIDAGAAEKDVSRMVMWEYPKYPIDDDLTDNDGDGAVDEPDESDPDIGYAFGQGYVVNANAPDGNYRPVAVFANGYNSSRGRAVLYIIDAAEGKLIRKIDTGAGGDNGLSVPALIDVNLDRCVDYVYAGDLKGNLWKFDLSSDRPERWGVAYGEDLDRNGVIDYSQGDVPQPVFQAGEQQPITARPDVMTMSSICAPEAPGYMLVFGTGKYLGASDFHDIRQQSIYGLWDFGDDDDDSETLGRLVNRSTGLLSSGLRLARRHIGVQFSREGAIYRQLSESRMEYTTGDDDGDMDGVAANNRTRTQKNNPIELAGWFLDFPIMQDSKVMPAERVTGRAVIRHGQAVILSFLPTGRPCEQGGYSWVYILDGCGEAASPKPLLDIAKTPKRYEGRLNDSVVVLKNAAAPGRDAILCSDLSGRIIQEELFGEMWGKVFWRQD